MKEKYNINQTTLRIMELYTTNYAKQVHLREIARAIAVDVKATLLQLNRLESLNILISTRKGRHKEYTLNLHNLLTRNFLVMAELFKSTKFLADNFPIKKILSQLDDDSILVLFGSYAKSTYTEESDIDIFSIGETSIEALGKTIGKAIFVKSATEKQFFKGLDRDPLVKEVVSSHIVLKNAEKFCDILWRFYAR
jgi:predicted nucleotidyltransferase